MERFYNISVENVAAYNSPDEDYPSVNSRAEINVDEISCLDNENEQFLNDINFTEKHNNEKK